MPRRRGAMPLLHAFPKMPFHVWPDVADIESVRYALVWNPPPGLLKTFPNLKAVLALGAGVDGLLSDSTTPDVPVIRLLDAGLAPQMAEYAVYAVLHFHRGMPAYQAQQAKSVWQPLAPVPSREWAVGVMGTGIIGGLIARNLVALGYAVRGWSRTGTRVDGVESFAGDVQLDAFLSGSRVVVEYAAVDWRNGRHTRRAHLYVDAARQLCCEHRPGRAPHRGRSTGGARLRPHRGGDARCFQ